MIPTDLVLSYGDLIRQSGYQTRVMGELRHLEKDSRLEPYLLAFDRDAIARAKDVPRDIPSRFRTRHGRLFYPEITRLARERRIRIVHAHNLYSAALALTGRPFWRYKVVVDLHGRIPEEYVALGKGGSTSRRVLTALERWTVTRADHVAVVSERLRDYLLRTYPIPPDRVSVIPCCADAARFNWDSARRKQARQRLGLDGKLVCVHLGSFSDWYDPDVIVGAFRQIRDRRPSAHLLVVALDASAAAESLRQRLPEGAYSVTSVSHAEVPALLNAADLAFLLLPERPNIEVSSPTKFSEYLNCGLPVVISPGVGDFSALVERESAGRIWRDGESSKNAAFLDELSANRDQVARRCVEAGRSLRWEYHRERWDGIVSRCVDR
jgi:glycosyltransferase involved in cell wall biosynthesis